MKKYKVTVNGTAYEIELEELTGAAPATGTILDVRVQNGSAVKKGDVLMILEAMKMENEIMCPCDGKVASINTSKGAAVESGSLLCVIQ